MWKSVLKILGGFGMAGTGSYLIQKGMVVSAKNMVNNGPALKTVGGVALASLGAATMYGGYLYTSYALLDAVLGRPRRVARDFGSHVVIDADLVQ